MNYKIFTDGSYKPSTRRGGYALIILDENENIVKKIMKGINNTTNNRMELCAILSALINVPDDAEQIEIISDSEYSINSFKYKWIDKWKSEDFKERPNADLWREVIKYKDNYDVKYTWVKGHNGNKYNEIVDSMAQLAADVND